MKPMPPKAAQRTAKEKQIQRDIINALRQLGFDVNDLTQPRRTMMPRGLPDLYVRHRHWGIRLFIEVKRPEGKTSPFQDYWIETELAAGGNAIVARNIDDILTELRRLGCKIQ